MGGVWGVHILPQRAEPAAADKTEPDLQQVHHRPPFFSLMSVPIFIYHRKSEDSKKRGAMMHC